MTISYISPDLSSVVSHWHKSRSVFSSPLFEHLQYLVPRSSNGSSWFNPIFLFLHITLGIHKLKWIRSLFLFPCNTWYLEALLVRDGSTDNGTDANWEQGKACGHMKGLWLNFLKGRKSLYGGEAVMFHNLQNCHLPWRQIGNAVEDWADWLIRAQPCAYYTPHRCLSLAVTEGMNSVGEWSGAITVVPEDLHLKVS